MNMKVQTKVQKWGNSLAIRLSGVMKEVPHFSDGMPVEVVVTESGLQIRKIKPRQCSVLPFSETELLADLDPYTAHTDLVTKLLPDEY